MLQTIISANKIFTGETWLNNHSVVAEDGIIKDILPTQQLSATAGKTVNVLIPAFIDLQIYGAHGKLLAVYPETDSLYKLYDFCTKGGAAYFLPTVATNTQDVFFRCIDAIRKYWDEGGKGCLGLHVEGPWINKAKRGAHIEELVHSPTLQEVKELLQYGKDVIKIITLAPEVCSDEVIEYILSNNIIISAGHSNATYQQATDTFSKGITAVTHLYNAMSGLMHREAGLAGAAFLHPTVMASIIADGYHVDYTAITIAKKLMQERLFLITDAVTDTNKGYYQHLLEGDKYVAGGILSGSSLTMYKALKNMIEFAGVSKEEAIKMASVYPAKVIRNEKIGSIKKGCVATMLSTDDELSFVEMVE